MEKAIIKRGAGILLHISSLPNEYGIGSLGKEAYQFVDFLHSSGQKYWQILPLSPTSIGNSPYQSCSAFASNYFFLDLELLCELKLLTVEDLEREICKKTGAINFEKIRTSREQLLRKAFNRFDKNNREFLHFANVEDNINYGVYMSLKNIYKGKAWYEFRNEHKFYSRQLVQKIQEERKEDVLFYIWLQFEFDKQWANLKAYAEKKGVAIIGDMPIYLSYDSVESWSCTELLQLDKNLKPPCVAGVPPDYFSQTGQLWGNPLYNWEYHKKSDYKWWKKRIDNMLSKCDIVRIDHFRGFYEYYSIPSNETTARKGKWRKGGGVDLFNSLPSLTKKRIIAEDLGLLDEGALEFFKKLGFPGMKVLQFAFDGNIYNPHLPDNCTKNSVMYTGTHDNDTLRGWLSSMHDIKETKQKIRETAMRLNINKKAVNIKETCWLLIEIALSSISDICIIPMQDYLSLGKSHRMNVPGTVNNKNWAFRLKNIPYELSEAIHSLAKKHERI